MGQTLDISALLKGRKEAIRAILAEVNDPEVPVLSVLDLGIIREIRVGTGDLEKAAIPGSGRPVVTGERPLETTAMAVEIVITPTYSGCPAMDMIRMNIRMALLEKGYDQVKITTVLSPAWTTDWMSEEGKEKLRAYGIAPPHPVQQVCHTELFHRGEAIQCPQCHSYHTQLISQFGSTACKALYRCEDCQEPFDYFKCH